MKYFALQIDSSAYNLDGSMVMYSKNDINSVAEIVLKDVPEVDEIILFGSYANDSANEESDIDLMVLTTGKLERIKKLEIIKDLRQDIASQGYSADILLKSRNEYHQQKNAPTLSRTIEKQGISLWKSK